MLGQSLKELGLIAKYRSIRGYQSMSKDKLLSMLEKLKSKQEPEPINKTKLHRTLI